MRGLVLDEGENNSGFVSGIIDKLKRLNDNPWFVEGHVTAPNPFNTSARSSLGYVLPMV